MGLAGAAYGASQALEQILGEQMKAALLKQQAQERMQRMQLEQDQFAETQRRNQVNEAQSARELDMRDADRRDRNNVKGVRRMLGDAIVQRTGPMTDDDRRGLAALQVEAGDAPTMLQNERPKKYRDIKTQGGKLISVPEDEPVPDGTQFYQEERPSAADVTDLTPQGLDIAALNYKKTGAMPALGMGDKVTRKRIIDRAAVLTSADVARIEAGGNDIASNKADYAADSASLTALQKQRDAVGAFEDTALKNLEVFLGAAKKIPDTGAPWLNRPLRSINRNGLGAADIAAYDTARLTVIPEFAKILSNPTLSGQLTDTARAEVERVVSGDASLKQTLAAAEILKQDVRNRKQSYDDAIASIRQRRQKGKSDTGGGGGSAYQEYLKKHQQKKPGE